MLGPAEARFRLIEILFDQIEVSQACQTVGGLEVFQSQHLFPDLHGSPGQRQGLVIGTHLGIKHCQVMLS